MSYGLIFFSVFIYQDKSMRTFKGSIKTDVQGSDVEFEFEVEDNATQTEIEYEAKQAAFEHVEWNFEEVKGV
ncbi:hypothetical protein KNHN1_55640 (plasmid) [Pseudomonas guariconensis]